MKTDEDSRTLFTIDGQLSGESVALLETSCNTDSNGNPLCLFLRDVTAVDPAGEMLLRRLAASGVRLVGSGVYTSWLVESLAANALQHNGHIRRKS